MLADMIRYNSQKQMTIGEFKTPFQARMDKRNRWVKLAESLPWDSLADIYLEKPENNTKQNQTKLTCF